MGTINLISGTMKFPIVLLLAATACVSSASQLTAPKDEGFCETCQEVVGKVKDIVSDPSFGTEVTALWYTLCDSLPFFQDECKEVGEEYIPELIAELKKDLEDPKAICQALGLCPTQKSRISLITLESKMTWRCAKL